MADSDDVIAELRRLVEDWRRRAEHAERKWHAWHVHTGTFGITCPKCQSAPEESELSDGFDV